jgi:cytochrome c biogenesis protein CcmG/thiol:disulfide interchange protein DsbE
VKRPAVPIAVVVVSALLVGLLVYGVAGGGTNTTLDDAVKAGERPVAPASDIARPLLVGGSVRLADFRGEVVVLNFWASWCEPCRAEAPLLQAAQERLQRAGAGTVLGATHTDATADSKEFEEELGLDFPSVRDVDLELFRAFGGTGVPETHVIDREGRVVALSRGQVSEGFLAEALDRAGVPR